MFKKVFVCLTLFFSVYMYAHDQAKSLTETGISARVAIGYRDKGNVQENEAYLIPGSFLGGEATPVDKGVSLDDIQLLGDYNVGDRYTVSAKITAHNHGGESSIEIENLWFTWDTKEIVSDSLIELGRLNTDTTYTANYHASESLFGEAPLFSDVYFGRHFNDMGLRVKSIGGLFNWGLEFWDGDAWPASANEGAVSAFLTFKPKWERGEISLHLWGMTSDAKNRFDDRYNEHSHGANPATNTGLIGFTGSTDMIGTLFTAAYQLNVVTLHAETEWIRAESSGTLSDDVGLQSGIESITDGARFLLGVKTIKHEFVLQYEEIQFDNIFQDSVNLVFLNQTGLNNPGFNPNKFMASWLWSFHSDFKLRVEWLEDDSLTEGGHSRGAIGLLWKKRLF